MHWSSLADWLPGNRKWQWPLETPPARRNWADFVLPRSHWRSPTLVEVHQRPETGRCKNVDEYEAPWESLGYQQSAQDPGKHQNIQCSIVTIVYAEMSLLIFILFLPSHFSCNPVLHLAAKLLQCCQNIQIDLRCNCWTLQVELLGMDPSK